MTAPAESTITTQPKTRRTATQSRRRRPTISVPRIARDHEVEVGSTSVQDPYDANARIVVPVNRRVDVLATERGTGRITEAQFLVGRMMQAVFERTGPRFGSCWGEGGGSRDQTIAHDLAIIYAIDDADRVRKFTAKLEEAVGAVGTRFLRDILTGGHTFASYAAARGRGGELGVRSVAERFRWLLEALTEVHHTAVGPTRAPIRGQRLGADQTGPLTLGG